MEVQIKDTNTLDLTDENLTEEEKDDRRAVILQNEDEAIRHLLGMIPDEKDEDAEQNKTLEIYRNVHGESTLCIAFTVHPLSSVKLDDIRKKYTKYDKNRRNGVKVATGTDSPRYRASLIYNSTVESDQKKFWENKKLWKGLEAKGKVILNALDCINATLLPGEIDYIIDELDTLNGFNTEDIQANAKN
jgi:hypothetical protein